LNAEFVMDDDPPGVPTQAVRPVPLARVESGERLVPSTPPALEAFPALNPGALDECRAQGVASEPAPEPAREGSAEVVNPCGLVRTGGLLGIAFAGVG
jgi:hypothetical protein